MRSRNAFLCGGAFVATALAMGASQASETTAYTYDALGRLVLSATAGGLNSGGKTATCFDRATNRTSYFTGSGTPPTCAALPAPSPAPAPTPTPVPSPTPTPTPTGNQPPIANPDSYSLACNTSGSVNLTANDTDPENNVPLVLRSIAYSSGNNTTTASVANASTATVATGIKGVTVFIYTVADSLGATSTGQLTVTSTGNALACAGGGTNAVPDVTGGG